MQKRVVVYELEDGSEEVIPMVTQEDEQHERVTADREMHDPLSSVKGYRFEYRDL